MEPLKLPLEITGIGAIKKELRDLKGELANATDSEQIAKLSQRAGELKDQLADANEQVKIFASGSKFEQVNNGLGSIKDSLMSLDFAEAGDKAKVFTTMLKGINPADFAEQFKGFGTVLKSLGSTIGIVAKQFISFGVSLLANPIFLLVAVITAIVAAILIFLNKIGVLKKVIDTLMAPINALIQGFKDLTDWIGLTSYAAEENAAKMEQANERVVASSKDRQEKVVGALDYEIKMAKIYGQETLDLELKKSKVIGTEAKTRIASAKEALKAEYKLGSDADKEKITKLKAQIKENETLLLDERRNRNLLVAQDAVDRKEQAAKELNDVKEKNAKIKKANEDAARKAAEAARKFAADRLAAQRTIKDIELSLIENDSERERKITQEKYARLIEDTQKNESYTAEEKLKLKALYEQQLKVELDKQTQTELNAEKEKQKKINEQIKANQEAQLQAEEDFYEQYRLQIMSEQQREIEGVNAKYFQLIANAEKYGLDTKALKEQQEAEIKKIEDKYREASIKAEEEKQKKIRDAQLKTANDALKITEDSTKAIQAIGDIAFAAKMSKVEKGSKEEEELAKKQFKFNKSMQLAGAIIDAGKAVTASLASAPLAIGPVPNPLGIASLAAAVTTSAANIAKIASTQFTSTGGGGNNAPTIPSASSTSTTNATPSVSLFGQGGGNGMNETGAPQEQSQTNITVKAVVSETELTNTQQKVAKINKNAEL